jgi:FkbM family methyltransferase
VPRYDRFQADALIKTGRPHIQPELDQMLKIVATLPQDCVVIDAGANIGLVSIPIAQAVKDRNGTVYAFEPQRMLAYALCGAAALNDIENLFVCSKGLDMAEAGLIVPKVNYGEPQDFGTVELNHGDGARVEVTTIDAFRVPRLDFLKIDVEGMEVEVMKGGRATIATHQPWCWVEYWKAGKDAIKAQFDGLDYRFYLMDELNMLCAPASRSAGFEIKAPQA